jgi:hypothetical protein
MGWYLLQYGIFGAIVISNAAYHWTPNMYLPSLLGWLAALVATGVIGELIDTWRRWRSRPPSLPRARG